MTRRVIKLKFSNGLHFATCAQEMLRVVADSYEFVDSDSPDFIIFMPDGSPLPPRSGNYVTIGWFIENNVPDLSLCDWTFGIHDEVRINDPRYLRMPWRGFACTPADLVKGTVDVEAVLKGKSGFCNYLFSSETAYRQRLFRELSTYKRIDSPARSMNNMPPIDQGFSTQELWAPEVWHAKRSFQRRFKFSIACENYSYPGYDSEKLVDAMLANTVPIYFGNPEIGRHFNTASFINGHDYIQPRLRWVADCLQECSQYHMSIKAGIRIPGRVTNRLKAWSREVRMALLTADFRDLIARVIEVDNDDSLYADYLQQPWYPANRPPSETALAERWHLIFSGRRQERPAAAP